MKRATFPFCFELQLNPAIAYFRGLDKIMLYMGWLKKKLTINVKKNAIKSEDDLAES